VCDTLCIIGRDRTLFAKNSDRPFREPQVFESYARREPNAAAPLRTQYLAIEDAGAYAIVGSRPTWLWGLEHGVNEYGVAIGNERIRTIDDPRAQTAGLLGMDLVRLGLERARTAEEALAVMTSLLETHGQGGSGERDRVKPYFSSFLIADRYRAFVLETSARSWHATPVIGGAAISNRIGAESEFEPWRDPEAPTTFADRRLAVTVPFATARPATTDARDVVATLRHHGTRAWGRPGGTGDSDDSEPPPTEVGDHWHGISICMHVRGHDITSASFVAELGSDDGPSRVWACLGNPCVGVYVPVFPPAVPVGLGDERQWERFARLRERVESDGDSLAEIRAALAPVEAALWDEADQLAVRANTGELAAFAARAWRPVDAALSDLSV
jgi:hypothetical protein